MREARTQGAAASPARWPWSPAPANWPGRRDCPRRWPPRVRSWWSATSRPRRWTTRSRLAAMAPKRWRCSVRCLRQRGGRCDVQRARPERFGTVHIPVNNAARVPNAPAEGSAPQPALPVPDHADAAPGAGHRAASLSDDDWLRWWGVNMHGVFYCTRAALRADDAAARGQDRQHRPRSPAWAPAARTAPAIRRPRPA